MFNKKIIGLILKQKMLRVTLILSAIFIIIVITLVVFSQSYANKIASNQGQMQDIKMQLEELDEIVNEEEGVDDAKIGEHAFASYEEIVPFISLLESLFAIIDKESEILVRDKEGQILINRYADYEVKLKPGKKIDLFLKALNELHKSKYITKVTKFVINYVPDEEGDKNEMNEVNLTIRLYFE